MRSSGIYFDHSDPSRKNKQMLTKHQLVKREMLYQMGGADKSFLKKKTVKRGQGGLRWMDVPDPM